MRHTKSRKKKNATMVGPFKTTCAVRLVARKA